MHTLVSQLNTQSVFLQLFCIPVIAPSDVLVLTCWQPVQLFFPRLHGTDACQSAVMQGGLALWC